MKVGYQGKSQPAMTQALPDTLVYAQHQSYMVQISLDYYLQHQIGEPFQFQSDAPS